MYVKEFKKDPTDETIAVNACIASPPNLDFDGKNIFVAVVKLEEEIWNPKDRYRSKVIRGEGCIVKLQPAAETRQVILLLFIPH